jgi:DNA polymerase-3 subunit epsilon
MRNAIASIDYEITGSELIALLRESHEIKQQRPIYNRAQRRALSHYGLYTFQDEKGYIQLRIEKNTAMNEIPLCSFSTIKSAKSYLHSLVDDMSYVKNYVVCIPPTALVFSF